MEESTFSLNLHIQRIETRNDPVEVPNDGMYRRFEPSPWSEVTVTGLADETPFFFQLHHPRGTTTETIGKVLFWAAGLTKDAAPKMPDTINARRTSRGWAIGGSVR